MRKRIKETKLFVNKLWIILHIMGTFEKILLLMWPCILMILLIKEGVGVFVYKRYEGLHCLEGQSEGTMQAEKVMQCAYRCEETPMCTSFTYFKENLTCDLKHPVSKQKLTSSPINIPGCMFFYKVSNSLSSIPLPPRPREISPQGQNKML